VCGVSPGKKSSKKLKRDRKAYHGQDGMDHLPCLQEQNARENQGRYGARKLPVVLSEVQAGKPGEHKKIEYVSY